MVNYGHNIKRLLAFTGLIVGVLLGCQKDPLTRLRSRHRAIEARVTGLDYAALNLTRSNARVPSGDELLAVGALRKRIERERTPENLHRLAVAKLAVGETE